MLKNIKSIYFIKNLFTFLDDGIKLKLINYNKSLQNIIDINLMNYRRYAKTYIIYENNNIGKEYNSYNDDLLFEGEFLNGKRNGKGKEFYKSNNKLLFEGEYLNGKRNGKGKEYNNYGQYELSCEYIDGKRCELNQQKENLNNNTNGRMQEYDKFGNIIFDGEYLNGLKNGKCREFFKNNLIFEGEYLNGKKWNGKLCVENENDNIIYEIKNGNGIFLEINQKEYIIFEGEYINGLKNGKGKEYDIKLGGKLSFEGEYKNGLRNGKGKEYHYRGFNFEGNYLNGKRNGKGKEYIYDK